MRKIFHIFYGIAFVGILAFISFVIARTEFITKVHLSVLIIGVVCGMLCSPIFKRYQNTLSHGVEFSAKRLLRLGIILFGFNISIQSIINVGVGGIAAAFIVISIIFLAGSILGIKLFKLDSHTAMLISIGSAVCGAAAVLAMESVLKSESSKGVLAIASVVIFGLCGMFLLPFVLNSNIIPLDDAQKGIFIGLSLHEVANVVGASSAISSTQGNIVQENALIVKMIRVIFLVPLLFVAALFIDKKEPSKTIYIPWFAVLFLVSIVINSLANIPHSILEAIKLISHILLTCAMIALGLQIDLNKMKRMGSRVFALSFVLFIFLVMLAYVITKHI